MFYRYVIYDAFEGEWIASQRNFRTTNELSKAAIFAREENAIAAIRYALRYGLADDGNLVIRRLRVELEDE